jgi:uncharacterized cupin superfamily protein
MSEILKEKIKLEELQKKNINISGWSKWECEPSEFDWEYSSKETAYVFEGYVIVTPEKGEPVIIEAGELVQFPKGMKCKWKVNKTIRKVYTFDDITL